MQKLSNKNLLIVAAIFIIVLVITVIAYVVFIYKYTPTPTPNNTRDFSKPAFISKEYLEKLTEQNFGSSIVHDETMDFQINPAIANNFSTDEIKNIGDMESAYGIKFSNEDKKMLQENKFLVKQLTSTNIRPYRYENNLREFLGLYKSVNGGWAPSRKQQNSIFLTSDIFMHSYQLLYVELLKESENKYFYSIIKDLSVKFYEESSKKITESNDPKEIKKWTKVRNYFIIPYAILSTVSEQTEDDNSDTQENVIAFIDKLNLDKDSKEEVISDIQKIYSASEDNVPSIFKGEYGSYDKVNFTVDFTQFTPRSHYTGSPLRRQYFRAMNWYTQLPFFLESADLTSYAFAISQLMAENQKELEDYSKIEKAINYLVGTSDDLMPVDYLLALESAKNEKDSDKEAKIMDYLVKTHNPKIKSLPAYLPDIGSTKSDELMLATKGMRFFSGKFIIDSYWTGYLTQGDEAPKPGYEQKLPPMASSLEVMSLLGSDYANSQIKKLDFYKPSTSKAIDKAMLELKQETDSLDDNYWQSNIYNGWLWVIKSLFDWQKTNRNVLPEFIQSPLWDVKTLMTASGFWTELRHATLLYAKQSFAESGAGGDEFCEDIFIPEPAKGYIEPQFQTYKRLATLARRTQAGYKDMNLELSNLGRLESYIDTMDLVLKYTQKELVNTAMYEKIKSEKIDWGKKEDGSSCIQQSIDGESDWETIRLEIVAGLESSLPILEGDILSAKDRRAAIVADVHTGGDSNNPKKILYEGTGVPKVIFVAVKDANGARLTIGFTYSHYEFTKLYGGKRLTDEEWQKNFYIGDDDSSPYNYTDISKWPEENFWYKSLFGSEELE